MRVISGIYKGTKLKGDKIKGTRPTTDRNKEAIFGMIQDYVKNAVCLDLFAGSGQLGIEALSNGAKEIYFVDNNKKAVNIIKENLEKLNINANVIYSDYQKALQYFNNKKIEFDVIFLDPPYDRNLVNDVLDKIKENKLLKKNGIIICEYEKEEMQTNFEILKDKQYGKTKITIYT